MRGIGLAFLGLVLLFCVVLADQEQSSDQEKDGTAKAPAKSPRIMTLAESIKSTMKSLEDPEVEQIRKQYWRKTLEDIEKLSFGMAMYEPYRPSQWKNQLVDDEEEEDRKEPKQDVDQPSKHISAITSTDSLASKAKKPRIPRQRPRFEGFPSWERMLNEWAEEVQEYMLKVEKEAGSEYLLANYGRPLSSSTNHTIGATGREQTQPTQVEPLVIDSDAEDVMSGTANGNAQKWKPQSRRKNAVPAPLRDGEAALPHTDLSDKSKRIEIVTTAALPWRTGTAVNPLLRAAYMLEGRKESGGSVTLMLPWLERRADQERVYGTGNTFDSQEEQETYIRTWLRESANMDEASRDLQIRWYTAWQNVAENSLYSMGDITALIPAEDVDIMILEEPEHMNWYRAPGESWTKKFKHVVGILHTNYFQYALDQPAAIVRAPAMRLLCSWMCRAHCHRIIKLSGTLDKVAPEKELVENVHGVRATFLDVGAEVSRRITQSQTPDPVFGREAEPTIYFIGKMLWSKGIDSLMELLKYAEESADIKVKVDMYGGGPDKDAAEARSKALGLNMPFHGPLDHAELDFSHKVFVNPSTSEVLCTTSAEALAMGKFLIVPSHVSNDFFAQFPNCLSYASKDEFVGNLFYAMTHPPKPLSKEYLDALSWEAATKRLEAAGCIPVAEAEMMEELQASKDGGVEIALPPLIEDEKRRKQISTTFRNTRERYRQFRSRLSSEILQNRVLPKKLGERIAADLERQLDVDIDELLESPKLRLKLSPAELDKSLLELYDKVSAGPSGDVLRVIGGGGSVGLQNMYMRRQAMKQKGRADLFPFDIGEIEDEEGERSTSQWVRWTLRRNLPTRTVDVATRPFGAQGGQKEHQSRAKARETPKMTSTSLSAHRNPNLSTWSGLSAPLANKSRVHQARRTFTLLI